MIEYMPLFLFLGVGLVLLAGYPVALSLGGTALAFAFAGGAVILGALYGLALEGADDPDVEAHHGDDHHDDGPDGDGDEVAEPGADGDGEEVTA